MFALCTKIGFRILYNPGEIDIWGKQYFMIINAFDSYMAEQASVNTKSRTYQSG